MKQNLRHNRGSCESSAMIDFAEHSEFSSVSSDDHLVRKKDNKKVSMSFQQVQVQPANVQCDQGGNPVQYENAVAAPTKFQTQEKCPKGHDMVLHEYQSAHEFMDMHTTTTTTTTRHRRHGKGAGAHHHSSRGRTTTVTKSAPMMCGSCAFNLMPNEKVFICETCIVGTGENWALNLNMFCETCVTDGTYNRPMKSDWSTGLCSCGSACCAFVDATLCWPCKAAGLATFMGVRYDGRAPGEDARCGNHCRFIQAGIFDICFLGAIGACMVGNLSQQAAVRNYIVNPVPDRWGSCCAAYFCRPCVLARIHREFLTRKEDLGEPMGCLCNCSGEPTKRKPSQKYTKGAPQAVMAMGQQAARHVQGAWGQAQTAWSQPQQQ